MPQQSRKPVIRSVKFNVLMNIILTTSGFLFPLITVPYVSRVLGPANNGIVSWAFAFVGYFTLVAMLGFNMYGTRECAKVRDDPEKLSVVVQELLIILMCSASIAYIAYLAFVFCLPRTKDQLPLMLIASVLIWLSAFGAEWFYRAIEQYEYITFRNIAFKLIALILMFVFVHQTNDYLTYAVINIIGSSGSNVLNILRIRSFVTFSRKYKMNFRRHFKGMFAFSISGITSGMYVQVDMLLVGFFVSNYAIGLYQLVFKIRNLCTSAGSAVTSVMLPRLSYYESTDGNQRKTTELMAKNMNFLLMLGLSIITALVICAEPIIAILGGNDYLGAAPAMRISAPIVLISSISAMLSQYMIAADHEKALTITNVVGLALAVALECALIPPPMGISGAALGLVITELVVYAMRAYVLRDYMKHVRKHTDYGRIIVAWTVASVAAGGMFWLVCGLNPFLSITAAAMAFLVVFGILLVLFKEVFVMSMIHSRRRTG